MLKLPGPRMRAREAGIQFAGLPPGPHNAITDVPGVRVGHSTLFSGSGKLVHGFGPVRTGCTVILPGPDNMFQHKVPAASFVLNGFGKAVGLPQIDELGDLESPIALTNTLSVPRVADALLDYLLEHNQEIGEKGTVNPVVGECNDGYLNDIRGRHVAAEHVHSAITRAAGGPVPEGAVGAGVGMRCMGYKGGIGTASRSVEVFSGSREEPTDVRHFNVGVLVLANFGKSKEMRVAGFPVGRFLVETTDDDSQGDSPDDDGSIVMIVATDAPVSSRQLGRMARRAALGLARVGSTAAHGSGDFVIAFSAEHTHPHRPEEMAGEREFLYDNHPGLNRLFTGTVEATEEAILNALFVADTVVGRDDRVVEGLPVDEVIDIIRAAGERLARRA